MLRNTRKNKSKRHPYSALFVIALATPAFAQEFHFGLKVGVPVTDYFETGHAQVGRRSFTWYSAATRRYTVGASAEVGLKHGFAFEFDALYKRMGYVRNDHWDATPIIRVSSFDVKGNSWDFPMMMKYRLNLGVSPFVSGGIMLRHIGPVRARGEQTVQDLIARTTVTTPIDTSNPPDLTHRNFLGLITAGGIEVGHGRLRLLPEFRYTYLITNFSGTGNALRLQPHQAEFLLGFLF